MVSDLRFQVTRILFSIMLFVFVAVGSQEMPLIAVFSSSRHSPPPKFLFNFQFLGPNPNPNPGGPLPFHNLCVCWCWVRLKMGTFLVLVWFPSFNRQYARRLAPSFITQNRSHSRLIPDQTTTTNGHAPSCKYILFKTTLLKRKLFII